jgi:uncharacterized membrane protein YwaF
MLEFLRKFMIDGFERGDFTGGSVHVVSLVFSLISIIAIILLLRKKDSAYIHGKMRIIAYFTITIYLLRRGVKVYQGEGFIEAFWPFYLCNVNTVLLSIWIIFDIKRGKDFMIITGMSGAVLAFIIPQGIFNDRFLTLTILDSVLSHYEIVAIPIILMATKAYELDIKKVYTVVLGLLLVALNVEILQPLLINEQVDYLFLDGVLPFTIEGVNQFFIMFGSALVYVYFVYFLDYLYLGKVGVKNQIEAKRYT